MEILERLSNAGVVPVVVIEHAEDAVPTAKALLAGGIDVMEITPPPPGIPSRPWPRSARR